MAPAALGLHRTLFNSLKSLPIIGDLLAFAQRNQPVISEGQVAQYHHDGFMIFDPQFAESLLDRTVSDLAKLPEMRSDLHHGSRVFNGWKSSRAVRALALAPRIL